MSSPYYLSNYTLKDFIKEEVIKVQSSKDKSSPPPPSQKDFLRAAKKDNASQFHPKKTSYIYVTSLLSSSTPLLIPVQLVSGKSNLPLSTLQLFFPLATDLHYTSGDKLVTLARSSSCTVNLDRVELSHQVFCIPFLGTEVPYLVSEENEVVSLGEVGSVVDGIVGCVRNIQTGMRGSLTELKKMEELVRKLQGLMKENVKEDRYAKLGTSQESFGDTSKWPVEDVTDKGLVVPKVVDYDYVNVNHMKKTSEQYGEEVSSGAVSVKDENLNYVDDYGFSDSEDVSEDIFCGKIRSQSVKASITSDDKPSDLNKLKSNSSSPATDKRILVSAKIFDEVSSSSSPKCVRRILTSKPVLSLLSSGPRI